MPGSVMDGSGIQERSETALNIHLGVLGHHTVLQLASKTGGYQRWVPAGGSKFQVGTRGGYRSLCGNFRWVPDGYRCTKFAVFTPYSLGSAAGENFGVT